MTEGLKNINDIYFDGVYKDIWKSLIPEQLTKAEVDFFISEFDLKESAAILDIMCGYGRHAIALARQGFAVTAVDNLQNYIDEIAVTTRQENLLLDFHKQDVMSFQSGKQFDLAICMGNSHSFFNEADSAVLFKNIADQLRPGGHFVINTWSIAEIAIPKFVARGTSKIDDIEMVTESSYLLQPTRIETINTFILPDGKQETKTAIDYIFSFAEMQRLLGNAGLSVKAAYSIPGRKLFRFGEPRLYLVAEKGK